MRINISDLVQTFLASCIFLLFFLGASYVAIGVYQDEVRFLFLNKTEARITSISEENHLVSGRHGRRSRSTIAYENFRYFVDGNCYYGKSSSRWNQNESDLVQIYYDPSNPSDSRLVDVWWVWTKFGISFLWSFLSMCSWFSMIKDVIARCKRDLKASDFKTEDSHSCIGLSILSCKKDIESIFAILPRGNNGFLATRNNLYKIVNALDAKLTPCVVSAAASTELEASFWDTMHNQFLWALFNKWHNIDISNDICFYRSFNLLKRREKNVSDLENAINLLIGICDFISTKEQDDIHKNCFVPLLETPTSYGKCDSCVSFKTTLFTTLNRFAHLNGDTHELLSFVSGKLSPGRAELHDALCTIL